MRRAAILLGLLVLAAPAHASTTSCTFAGPTGTSRATTFDLPGGSTTLSLTLTAAVPTVPGTSHTSWHVASGLVVVDLATTKVVAARLVNDGLAPRRALLSAPGQDTVVANAPGPGIPIRHTAQLTLPGLPAGRYAAVAFGADGDSAAPNPWWEAKLQIDGDHSCAATGSGAVFDHDAADFGGGTAVGAASALYAEATALAWESRRELVIGLVDANGGPGGTATVDYALPSANGSATNALVPFATRGGALSFKASAAGAATALDVAGVEVDLP